MAFPALTADAVKETIIRSTIKRQPMKKISAEVGISESTIGRITRIYALLTAEDWKGLIGCAGTYNGTENLIRVIEDITEIKTPGAIWNEISKAAEDFRARETLKRAVPAPPITPSKPADEPVGIALLIAPVLDKLDTIINQLSDIQKAYIANTEMMKNTGFAISDLPGKEILHALTGKITDCINANADVALQENRKTTNELVCAIKKGQKT